MGSHGAVASYALGEEVWHAVAEDWRTAPIRPELDRLVEWAYANGAYAARMTGGGFGGAIVALVADDEAASFGERMPARTWVSPASDGACELL